MPHSLVLNLIPQTPIPASYLTGRHLHALFLTLVSSVNRELANRLHQNHAKKGFNLSPLQIQKARSPRPVYLQWQHQRNINPETLCWWRVSLLDDDLFSHLKPLWLQINPKKPWHLGSADLHIINILGTPQSTQPWANACSYRQLYDQASDIERKFTFNFATPTAFRQRRRDTALPTPQLVFQSLLRRWNQYSEIPFENLPINAIFPSQFEIETKCVEDSRSKFIGCVGRVRYQIFEDATPIQIKQINTLADFALYCGIGRKTPMGMGMTRRVHNS